MSYFTGKFSSNGENRNLSNLQRSASNVGSVDWQALENERRLERDMADEFPLGTLSFSVDMEEMAALNPPSSHALQPESYSQNPVLDDKVVSEEDMDDAEEELSFDPSASKEDKKSAALAAASASKWSAQEDQQLKEIVEKHGAKSWKKVANLLGSARTDVQCLHRWNKVLKPGLHKGTWTKEEDMIVQTMVSKHGVGKVKWSSIAAQLPGRIGKQCRERWFNHLDPSIKKGEWTPDEELTIYEAQRHFGNRWCEISRLLPGRTENAVKNRWNSCAMKKWLKDKNLEPGPSNALKAASKAEVYAACDAFKKALKQHRVDPKVDVTQVLNELRGDNDSSSDDDREPPARFPGALSSSSGGPQPRVDLSFTGLGSHPALWPQPQSMQLPTSLRPQPLVIGGYALPELDVVQTLSKKPLVDNLPDVGDDVLARHLQVVEQTRKRQRAAASMSAKNEKSAKILSAIAEEEPAQSLDGSLSPTSLVLCRLKESLDGTSSVECDFSSFRDREVPIEALQFFPFLNEKSKKSLVKDLISRFQRTNFTPRDFVLANTPRYTPHSQRAIQEELSTFVASQSLSSKVVAEVRENAMDVSSSSENPTQRSTRKRHIDSHNSLTPADVVVDAVVAVILLAIESAPADVKRIVASLQSESLSELNTTIADILAEKTP